MKNEYGEYMEYLAHHNVTEKQVHAHMKKGDFKSPIDYFIDSDMRIYFYDNKALFHYQSMPYGG